MIVVGFALDMTLVDSAEGITATMRACLAEVGVDITPAQMREVIGLPLTTILGTFAPGRDTAPLAARYRELYPERGVPPTVLLPGAADAVRAIHRLGGRVLVISAKVEPAIRAVLRHVGLDAGELAPDAVTGDAFAAGKRDALRAAGATAYVGDHVADVEAARAAGALAVGVTTGAHDRETLLAAGADVVLDDLGALPDLVRELHAGGVPHGAVATP